MSKDNGVKKTPSGKRSIIVTLLGTIIMIVIIVATLEISRRNISSFVTAQQKYIVSIESVFLIGFLVEMLARLINLIPHAPQMVEHSTRLRLFVRIIGYTIGSLSVISILSSNATLGISIGAVGGVVIAFATQNIAGSVLAAVLITGTRMIKVGEDITVNQVTGTVSDINLTHTLLSVGEDVVYVPNSLIISSMVKRRKRNSDKGSLPSKW